MPILTVKVSGKKSRDLTARIADLLMDLTGRILKKKREVTCIFRNGYSSERMTRIIIRPFIVMQFKRKITGFTFNMTCT